MQRLKTAVPAARRRAAALGARSRASCSGSASRSARPPPREVFALVAKATPDYGGLDYRALGALGKALSPAEGADPVQEARA